MQTLYFYSHFPSAEVALFLVLPPPPSLPQCAMMGHVDSAVSSGTFRTLVSAWMTRLTFNAPLMPQLG